MPIQGTLWIAAALKPLAMTLDLFITKPPARKRKPAEGYAGDFGFIFGG